MVVLTPQPPDLQRERATVVVVGGLRKNRLLHPSKVLVDGDLRLSLGGRRGGLARFGAQLRAVVLRAGNVDRLGVGQSGVFETGNGRQIALLRAEVNASGPLGKTVFLHQEGIVIPYTEPHKRIRRSNHDVIFIDK